MVGEQHLPFVLYAVCIAVLLAQGSQAISFKAGKTNITVKSPGLFACETITFAEPFSGGKQVKVFASFGHSVNNQARGNGAAIWVESADRTQFRACIYEYSNGSNSTAEINWIALQSAPKGAQLGTTSLDPWTTGTECKKIDFPQVRFFFRRGCTRLLLYFNTNKPHIKSFIFLLQKINFTDQFYAPPVVMVTAERVNNDSHLSGCNAITAWVEYTSTADTEICVRTYDAKSKQTIKVDYLIIGVLDPCIDVLCDYHGLCKAFGPYDARCVCIDSCPQYQEPICSSNGTTYDNTCLFKQEMCLLQLNYTVQHPGSCEGFPFQRDRRHMPHIPSLGYSHCEVIRFRPFVFYPDKPIQVQITVNHIDTIDMNYVHDAAVSWIENVTYEQFTACVMAAGYNECKSRANVSIDWIAYQGAPVGGVTGEVRMSQWWTGTTCKTVNFPSSVSFFAPSVFVTVAHHHAGLKRDAASIWLEDISLSSFKLCLRELQNYAGSHEDIYANWLAFLSLHKPLFSEHSSIYFPNSQSPGAWNNHAFCRDISFTKVYKNVPSVFVSANHTSSGGRLDPMHNSITAWVEYINTTGARVCLKEMYESKYDPLSVSYTVLSDICQPRWSYFGGYCYFTSRACASWLTAESNCSTMSSNLVTVHNQEENVYIQHRHNGERSWIGLNDRSVEGSFVWTNKEISKFRFWAPQQPNDWKNEDSVHTLGAKHGYTWNDVPCTNCYNYTCFKVYYHSHSLIVKYILFKQASLAEKVMLFDKKPLCAFFFQTWMNVPLLPIPVTSIPYARIPWVHTHARVMLGTLEMESPAMISTSVLPTLTVVTLMRFVAILLDRTHAPVKQDSQAMEKHALISTSALQTLTAVTSMQCVAILWDHTHAPVKQDTQAMEGRAMVRFFVSFCFIFLEEPSPCTELLLFHRPFGRLTVILPYRKNSFTGRNDLENIKKCLKHQHPESPFVDVDECTSGLHSCHKFASCTNTIGSYRCSCHQYYNGDGKNCQHSVSGEFSFHWSGLVKTGRKHSLEEEYLKCF
ncbi:unnamed protein product [Porites evermanni]|uniref:Uncharacterized protein n=1 Tax=Porites evermanni TaxID=104178 RepID=A0ABN8SW16_9CNID|nr:unnamed protein product [Porites evermanni]